MWWLLSPNIASIICQGQKQIKQKEMMWGYLLRLHQSREWPSKLRLVALPALTLATMVPFGISLSHKNGRERFKCN